MTSDTSHRTQGPPESRLMSIYDLPIEYHLDTLEELEMEYLYPNISRSVADAYGSFLESAKRGTRFGSLFISKEVPSRRSRFEYLMPMILKKRLKTAPSYEFVREYCILKLWSEVKRTVLVLQHRLKCDIDEWDKEVPHRAFSWSKDDFVKRRKIKNFLWVELILMGMPAHCLENKKMIFDMNELLRYFGKLAKVFTTPQNEEARMQTINTIRNAHDFLAIEDNLKAELARNTEAVRKYLNDLLTMALSKNSDETRRQYILSLEQQIMNQDICDPIAVRYQVKYYNLIVDQVQIKVQNREQFYESEIRRYKHETQKETHCSQCTMDAMYADIEHFKSYIDQYSAKYKHEYELIDNQISYKKLKMDKLKASRKYLEEQIRRFHEELELLRLAEIAAKERKNKQETKRQEEIAAKKAKKGGKKGKKAK